ncbi:MAG: TolC family protein [Desulfobacterales bacterium]|nr:TolC family protein [Desulfobacterales bacterium]
MKATIIFFVIVCCWLVPGSRPAAATEAVEILTLADCVRAVLRNNPAITMAEAGQKASEAALAGAEKNLLPSFSARYDYKRQPDVTIVTENYYSYSVTVSQPLYQGKALVTAVDLGKLRKQAADTNMVKTVNDLVFAVNSAYFGVLKSDKLVEVARQAIARLESHCRDSQAFFDAGLIPKNDLLTSEVLLAQGRQDLRQAENRAAMARADLNLLMGNEVRFPVALADVLRHPDRRVVWEDVLKQALAMRPEIKEGELIHAQADKNVILARASYLPSLSLAATYLKQGDTPGAVSYPLGPSEVKQAQATLEWRFFAWGQSDDKVAEARFQTMQAQEALARIKDRVTLELREAFLGLEQARANIAVTAKAVQQAEENFRINESRYQAQLNTSTDVLDAQTLLTRARTNNYNALYEFNIALSRLDWATGVLGHEMADNQ